MRLCTTDSELKNPGPGFPFPSIQQSRAALGGGAGLATDVARVLGVDSISFASGEGAAEVCRLEEDILDEEAALDARARGWDSLGLPTRGDSGVTRRFLCTVCKRVSSFFLLRTSPSCKGFVEDEGVGRAVVTLIAGAPARGSEERGTATTRVVTTVDEPVVGYLDLEKKERSEEDAKGVEDELIAEEVVVGGQNEVGGGECYKFASMPRSLRRRLPIQKL